MGKKIIFTSYICIETTFIVLIIDEIIHRVIQFKLADK